MNANVDSAVLERLLEMRHSCRAFRDQSVPHETITRILTMAQRTASWCNAQPWQVIVTSGGATDRFRQALSRAAGAPPTPDIAFPERYDGVYLDRRRVCGFALYDSVGIARGDRAASEAQARRNFDLFDAPHAAIITAPAHLGPYGAIDCGGYIATFMLAAQSLGIASIAQAALATRSKLIHDHFRIGDDRHVVCGISFGYAEVSAPANAFRTERAPVEDAVTFLT